MDAFLFSYPEALDWLKFFQVQVSIPEWVSDTICNRKHHGGMEPALLRAGKRAAGWEHPVSPECPTWTTLGQSFNTKYRMEMQAKSEPWPQRGAERARCQSRPEILQEKDERTDGYKPQKITET